MSFNGNEGQFVNLDDAAKWTLTYRESAYYTGVNAIFYGKNKLATLLDQEGCMGLRIYNAIDFEGTPVMVVVGTDANENDILGNYILERGVGCPINCGGGGTTNPLQ